MVRPYFPSDGRILTVLHNAVFPDQNYAPQAFQEFVEDTFALGGFVWVIEEGTIAGYGLVVPIPGLPDIGELDGCIAKDRQRHGLGSRLWQGMVAGLAETDFRQVTYGLDGMEHPTALFLLKQNFFVEHEEWILTFDDWTGLGEINSADRVKLQTFPRQTAVPLFCDLYAQCFSGLPWDQPYYQKEVEETLVHAADLLFILREGKAIGLAWIKLSADGNGVIEPLGILPEYQNQGYGRILLKEAMHVLRTRGASQIEIGAWRENDRAVALYQSMGYQHTKTFTYLAYNLR